MVITENLQLGDHYCPPLYPESREQYPERDVALVAIWKKNYTRDIALHYCTFNAVLYKNEFRFKSYLLAARPERRTADADGRSAFSVVGTGADSRRRRTAKFCYTRFVLLPHTALYETQINVESHNCVP